MPGSDNESDQTLRSLSALCLTLRSVNITPSNGRHKLGVSADNREADACKYFVFTKIVLDNKTEDISSLDTVIWRKVHYTTLCECVGITAGCTQSALHQCVPTPGADTTQCTGDICPWVPALINISSKHFNTDSKYLTPHHNSLCCVICKACATWLQRFWTNKWHAHNPEN